MKKPFHIFRVFLRFFSIQRYHHYIDPTDHEAVLEHVRLESKLTPRFVFMVLMSCGIAMLGLLLSSPAVVIGAMLISPLMAPIISLGFSLTTLNIRQMRRSLESLMTGVLVAIAVACIIVYFSPLNAPTSEILARTQPNFFDLLVAVFSGLAGGYAVIKQKGETIVGVAIATALMPPLAVVGYGIATGSLPIAKGAGFLFMTNLLAISLSATVLAIWYGFARTSEVHVKHTIWQSFLVILVFGALSVPLGLSLKKIAYEAYVTDNIKRIITQHFGKRTSHIDAFSIAFPKEGGIEVESVVLSSKYRHEAEGVIEQTIQEKLKVEADLALKQVVLAQKELLSEKAEVPRAVGALAENALSVPVVAQSPYVLEQERMLEQIKQAIFFEPRLLHVDAEQKQVVIEPKPKDGVGITVLRAMEQELRARFPEWKIEVVPPVRPLPSLYFEVGAEVLDKTGKARLADIFWALTRWQVPSVEAVGYASSVGAPQRFDNSSLAYRRALHVQKQLESQNIPASAKSEYLTFQQQQKERYDGLSRFQRVDVRIGGEIPKNAESQEGAEGSELPATPPSPE